MMLMQRDFMVMKIKFLDRTVINVRLSRKFKLLESATVIVGLTYAVRLFFLHS